MEAGKLLEKLWEIYRLALLREGTAERRLESIQEVVVELINLLRKEL